jgi:hypothetical protein
VNIPDILQEFTVFMGNEKERLRLQFAAVGWDHDLWEKEFYPHGLPAQWRLTYYANEFRAVLVPPSYWQAQVIPDIAQWYEDVPPGFCFYIGLPFISSASSDGSGILQSLGPLKEKLAGFVLDTPKSEAELHTSRIRECCPDVGIFYPIETLSRQGSIRYWREARGRNAALLDCSQRPDLKSLRLLIEQFIARAGSGEGTLFIDGDMTSLRDAVTIAQLMGY